MRYNEFINESWPGNEFAENKNLENFIKISKDENHPHHKFIKASLFEEHQQIYRGFNILEFSKSPLIYLDPTKAPLRKSANTHNYYTWWIDDIDTRWKDYPKRGRSFICSSKEHVSATYGKNFLMIPLKDVSIGICPEGDMWNSFGKFLPTEINGLIKTVFEMSGCRVPINSNMFYMAMQQVNLKFKYRQFQNKLKNSTGYNHDLYYSIFSKFDFDIIKMMQEIYDPVVNKFTAINWPNESIPDGNHEIWFSSPCYGLKMNMVTKMQDAYFSQV